MDVLVYDEKEKGTGVSCSDCDVYPLFEFCDSMYRSWGYDIRFQEQNERGVIPWID